VPDCSFDWHIESRIQTISLNSATMRPSTLYVLVLLCCLASWSAGVCSQLIACISRYGCDVVI
jgi:hypothetical protein